MKSSPKKILVLDVGGTHVKIHSSHTGKTIKIPSGPKMTARQMVATVIQATAGWKFDVVSMGVPGPVLKNRLLR
jgi:polyphosphate glucokinase